MYRGLLQVRMCISINFFFALCCVLFQLKLSSHKMNYGLLSDNNLVVHYQAIIVNTICMMVR